MLTRMCEVFVQPATQGDEQPPNGRMYGSDRASWAMGGDPMGGRVRSSHVGIEQF